MKQTQPKPGIRERILAAQSTTHVTNLLNEARGYKRIHPSTLRACEHAADKRMQEVKA